MSEEGDRLAAEAAAAAYAAAADRGAVHPSPEHFRSLKGESTQP